MADQKEELKKQLQKKTLTEIETLIATQKAKMGTEKNMATLARLSSELSLMQEVHAQKLRESGRLINKNIKAGPKPQLKSFDDFVKSKK